MVRQTLLRVPKELKHKFEGALEDNLRAKIGDFTVEYYSKKPDLHRSYQRRVDSLDKAFQFVLDTIPMQSGTELSTLRDLSKLMKDSFNVPKDKDIDFYQSALIQYTSVLVGILLDHSKMFNKPDKQEKEDKKKAKSSKSKAEEKEEKKLATELLNKAEQYVIMSEGRPDLATLVSLEEIGKDNLVLLWDKQLEPCTKETIEEFNAIRESDLRVIPSWFDKLSVHQKIYLHAVNHTNNLVDTLTFETNNLVMKWQQIKLEASSDKVLQANLQDIASDKLSLPSWYNDLPTEMKVGIKSLISRSITVEEFDKRINELNLIFRHMSSNSPKQLTEIKKLPFWFLLLSTQEQRFLTKTLKQEGRKIEEIVSFLPSRLRTLPAMANSSEHLMSILDRKGRAIKDFDARKHSSHVASRDILDQPVEVQEMYTRRNLAQVCSFAKSKVVAIQTLVSPKPKKITSTFVPDPAVDSQRLSAIEWAKETLGVKFFATNHPFNYARLVDYTESTNLFCLEILNFAKSFSLLDEVPELIGHWDLAQIENLVKASFQEALEAKPDLTITLTKEEEEAKASLVAFFKINQRQISQWVNWQETIVNHLYLVNHQKELANEFFEYQERLANLAALAKEYKAVLNSKMGTATVWDYNGREVFLGTLEELIMLHALVPFYGSCMSGKDRKWIGTCETDSALMNWFLYDDWPKYTDYGANRSDFIKLVALIYGSRHGHEYAGQNAPGADGIKTPGGYWPGDIGEAIKKLVGDDRALEIDDILATNNEVSRIGRLNKYIKPHFSSFIFTSLKLSKENQQQLDAVLRAIVAETKFWEKKKYNLYFYKSAPEGIEKIKEILDNSHKRKYTNLTLMLAEIFEVVDERPENCSRRDEDTTQLYESIKKLYTAEKPDACFDEALKDLNAIQRRVYANKSVHA